MIDAPSLVTGKRARHESGCGSDSALEITGNALAPPVPGSNALLPPLSSITLPPREHIGSSSALELSGDNGGALEIGGSGGGSGALEPRGGSGALEPSGGSNLHLFLLNFLRNLHLFAIDMKAQGVEEASVLKALSLLRVGTRPDRVLAAVTEIDNIGDKLFRDF
mmetsp:Transcript_35945/g.89414  ORF Transcript_35945/g.89414 Transcript_35945/m.89414 type:complete len:165 (+) Transcript_35945:129-623(+)